MTFAMVFFIHPVPVQLKTVFFPRSDMAFLLHGMSGDFQIFSEKCSETYSMP